MATRRRLTALGAAYKAARRRFLERLATSRQARVGHEILMGVEGFLARGRFYAIRSAVGQKIPALFVILEISHHDLIEHLLVHGRIEDRAQDLDPAVKISGHNDGR